MSDQQEASKILPRISGLLKRPHPSLKKGKSEKVQWNEAQERPYSLLKEYLLQEPVLKLPDLMKPFSLKIDASGVGVAAVLLQKNKGKLYLSRLHQQEVEPSRS